MTAAKPLAGFEERWAEVRATRVRYFVAGDGPPVLLVHGLGGAAATWIAVAPPLAERHRVVVPDLPGHGGSSPVPALPNLNPFADAVEALLRREEAAPAAVVGHSLGGVVALRLALRHPDLVNAVVLAGAAGITSATRLAETALTFSTLVQPGRRLARFRRSIARSRFLRQAVFGGWGASDAAALPTSVVEAFLAGPPLHTDVASAAAALVRDDPRAELGGVRCRCLVLWGARDSQVPVGDAFEYARRLGADLRVIADCGHLLIGERPGACVDAIEDFLGDSA
ncbi:MAG: alpha/beta fold hydrolase [Thermoleophilia bacterium]|nr:alpha/beta fold hydrolase [Thermoleophilia bacterium]